MPGPDPAERIVNLALFLAAAAEPVTAEQCRAVEGYPPERDEDTFKRMFERDKDELRAAGFVIEVDRTGPVERYHLDPGATYAAPLSFSAEEGVLLRAAGAASLADPSFPYREDLRIALAKLLPDAGGLTALPVAGRTADEEPEDQAATVARLTAAAAARKAARFDYTNLEGRTARREVEPYGLFARDGRWYLVARDRGAGAMRVFAVTRMAGLDVEAARPRSPDFDRPADFDVASWMALPFQFGPRRTAARLRFSGPAALRVEALTGGRGRLERTGGEAWEWETSVADLTLLARWTLENGPGIDIVSPEEARAVLAAGLEKAVAVHGG